MSERAPKRVINMQEANKYRGQLGSQDSPVYICTERVWSVNGTVVKADGNLLSEFHFSQIG